MANQVFSDITTHVRHLGLLRKIVAPTIIAGALQVDCDQGDYFPSDVPAAGLTIQNPQNSPEVGHDILFLLQNWTNQPVEVTFGSAYRTHPSFTLPPSTGNGKFLTIQFIRVGNVWIQQGGAEVI